MKLNKEKLRELIMEAMNEADAPQKMASSQVATATTAQKKAMVQGGIDDNERAVIQGVSSALAQAAKSTNIMSGPLGIQIKRMEAVLEKMLGGS